MSKNTSKHRGKTFVSSYGHLTTEELTLLDRALVEVVQNTKSRIVKSAILSTSFFVEFSSYGIWWGSTYGASKKFISWKKLSFDREFQIDCIRMSMRIYHDYCETTGSSFNIKVNHEIMADMKAVMEL